MRLGKNWESILVHLLEMGWMRFLWVGDSDNKKFFGITPPASGETPGCATKSWIIVIEHTLNSTKITT